MNRIAVVGVLVVCVAVALSLPLYAQQYPQQQYPQQEPTYSSNQHQGSAYGMREIPAGANVSIRTNENIKASEAQPGSSYAAEISQDVMGQNGEVLIPRGSPARLTVVSTGKSTVGGNNLELALKSITVNGRTYRVESNTTSGGAGGTGIGKNKRTAEYVGGGAVLGTVIGAVAGGGKGAVLGGLLGGGAGAGAQVLTKGRQINVPAESVLTFHLEQPLQLR